jgi:hypothetical protein
VIKSFMVGAIAGAAVMYFYGEQIKQYADDVTGDLREKTAETIGGAAERLQTVAQTVEEGLTGAADQAQKAQRAARRAG